MILSITAIAIPRRSTIAQTKKIMMVEIRGSKFVRNYDVACASPTPDRRTADCQQEWRNDDQNYHLHSGSTFILEPSIHLG